MKRTLLVHVKGTGYIDGVPFNFDAHTLVDVDRYPYRDDHYLFEKVKTEAERNILMEKKFASLSDVVICSITDITSIRENLTKYYQT